MGSACIRCRQAFSAAGIAEMIRAKPGFIHYTPRELEQSASLGCSLCQLIIEQEQILRTGDDKFEYIVLIAEEDEPGDVSVVSTISLWPYPRRTDYGEIAALFLMVFAHESM